MTFGVDFAVSDEQAQAIGRLSIVFNWLESAVEFLILEIVCPTNERLGDVLIKKMSCTAKVQHARKLIAALPEIVKLSGENALLYQRFAERARELLGSVARLNETRNDLIHWRPFQEPSKQEVVISQTPAAIMTTSHEMGDTAIGLLELALLLRGNECSLNWEAFRDLGTKWGLKGSEGHGKKDRPAAGT